MIPLKLPDEGAAWDLSCPYCGQGHSISTGLEAERIIRAHKCPKAPEAAA